MGLHPLCGQVAAAVVMSMTPTIYGTMLSFAGLLLAESAGPQPRLTVADAIMIAAVTNFGRMVACVVSAQLTDRLGVRRVIQLGTPLNLLGWPLLALGGRDAMLAGSVLVGAVVGLTGLTGRLYIAEVTTSRHRSVLCYLPGVAIGLSLLANFSLSGVLPWRYATLLCGCGPAVVQVVGTVLLPDSPRWLLNRGMTDEHVRKSIAFYRGKSADIGREIKEIQLSLRGKPNLNIAQQIHLIFTDWDVGKPCLLMTVQFWFETFCGGVVLNQYAHSVFQSAVRSLSPVNCTQILATLQMAGIAGSGWLLHWRGRRTVLVGAALLTALGQLVVAAFFHFEAHLASHTWLVVIGIVAANTASMGGISQLSHLFLAETLPIRVRQMFGSAISLYMGALSALFIHLFPVLRAALGSAGLFAALAAVNVLQALFARCLLPETRGLTLEEVQVKHFSTRRQAREQQAARETAGSCGSQTLNGPPAGRRASSHNTAVGGGTTGRDNAAIKSRQREIGPTYVEMEQGVRQRKNSDRADGEKQGDVSGGQRSQVLPPTAEEVTKVETRQVGSERTTADQLTSAVSMS